MIVIDPARPKEGTPAYNSLYKEGRGGVMENELLTDRQAAEYLKLSPKWGFEQVQKWARKGLIKCGRVGDHYRFRKQDLDDFVFAKR